MGESFCGGNITSTRIPWKTQKKYDEHYEHQLVDLVQAGQFTVYERNDTISEYSLGIPTPMSPVKR